MDYVIIEKYVIERTAKIQICADSKEELMEKYHKGDYEKPLIRDENPQVNSILITTADSRDRYSDDYDDGGYDAGAEEEDWEE